MKNKIVISLAAALISSTLMAADSALIKKIEKIAIVKSIEGKVDKIIDHGSLYQVSVFSAKNGMLNEAFLTKDLSTIIFGEALDTRSGKQLLIPIEMNAQKVKEVASYSYGEGKNEYFLFTDPECPYCISLEKEIHSLSKDVKVYVVLFPLSFHENARDMSYYIMSQSTNALKAKAMSDIANGSLDYKSAKYSTSQLEKLNKELENGLRIAQTLRVNSTPTLLDSKGINRNYKELMN